MNPFLDRIAELQSEMENTIVPGEARAWLESVAVAFEAADRGFEAARRQREMKFSQILRDDLELAAKVEHLREKDESLRRDFQELRGEFERLSGATEEIAGSDRFRERVEDLRHRFAQCNDEIRSQENEVDTWLVEAQYRERGTVD